MEIERLGNGAGVVVDDVRLKCVEALGAFFVVGTCPTRVVRDGATCSARDFVHSLSWQYTPEETSNRTRGGFRCVGRFGTKGSVVGRY